MREQQETDVRMGLHASFRSTRQASRATTFRRLRRRHLADLADSTWPGHRASFGLGSYMCLQGTRFAQVAKCPAFSATVTDGGPRGLRLGSASPVTRGTTLPTVDRDLGRRAPC